MYLLKNLESHRSVIPSSFWNDADDFATNGVGYSVFYDGKLAAMAFSAFIELGKLELGIEHRNNSEGKA